MHCCDGAERKDNVCARTLEGQLRPGGAEGTTTLQSLPGCGGARWTCPCGEGGVGWCMQTMT
jgi:hypothetical protein